MTTGTADPPSYKESSSSDNEPLIGIDNLATPDWALAGQRVLSAGWWQAVRSLPVAIAVVVRLAWRTAPWLTVLAAVVHVVSGGVTAFGLLATANVFAALLSEGPTPARVLDSLPALMVVVTSYAARAGLDSAVAAVEGTLRPRVAMAADNEVTTALVGVRLLAFEDADFRELARKGERFGVRSIESSVSWIADLLASLVALTAAVVTAAVLDPWLAPTLLLAAVADGWAAARVAKLRYRHFLRVVTRDLRKNVIEEAATSRTLALERHALTLQQPLLGEYRRIAASLVHDEVRLAYRSTLVRLVGRAAAGVGTGAAYLVVGFLLYTGELPLALAGTAALAMRTSATALSNTMNAINLLYENSFYIDIYLRLLGEARRRQQARSAITAPASPRRIRLEGVSFTYPGQDKPVLENVTITLHRGEIVALVGENGSGKSTLAKILTGLYPPTEGAVFWDDTDLATADPASIHSRIAVIAQDPARWPMTAYRNITVGRLDRRDPAHRAWHAAVSQSGADEVLAALPDGEHTLLSRHFSTAQDLSGGQWQRLGIARGLYRDAPVLVADEPTAALDAKAEARVFRALGNAATHGEDRITVMITHRLANIRTADRILVLDRGRLVEHGTHEQLLAGTGPYQELYRIQAGAYRAGSPEA
ncbi:ABC transporter ATP-binding protein [Amycolatopsis rhizosphaerae]|uniref:ABC transporter ATP-binding protein n=1 Tax=Amycolatopsis rhizosphaerae TaxID=2053003 RepID=A0A558DAY8_9PSEU|nr:ABC transporter ATP-binding protein [Amycolatopsis rhizosphaerae]TVT58159.1 ABC transporter ATP-binding protein [Amycolatopsis rhizosphaerae]